MCSSDLPDCHSPRPERLFSRFAPLLTEEQLAEKMVAQYEGVGERNEPKIAENLLHDLGSAMGEDIG